MSSRERRADGFILRSPDCKVGSEGTCGVELRLRLKDLAHMSTNDFEQLNRQTGRRPVWLLLGFLISAGIAIAAVVRRLIALLGPSSNGPPQLAAMDATFSSHAVLTLAHILPAAVFVVLAVVVLLRRSSDVWLERLFFYLAL